VDGRKKEFAKPKNTRRRAGAGLAPHDFLTNTTPALRATPSSAEEGTLLSPANSFPTSVTAHGHRTVFYGEHEHDVFGIDAEGEFGNSGSCGNILGVAEYTRVTRESVQDERGARVFSHPHDLFDLNPQSDRSLVIDGRSKKK
jgi:hypothetical protein